MNRSAGCPLCCLRGDARMFIRIMSDLGLSAVLLEIDLMNVYETRLDDGGR